MGVSTPTSRSPYSWQTASSTLTTALGAGNYVYGVGYGDGRFVAVGNNGKIAVASSPSGSWTAASAPNFATDAIYCVAYGVSGGTGYWVAGGANGKIRYATDPTGAWSTPASVGFSTTGCYTVVCGDGTWIMGGLAANSLRYTTNPAGTWSAPALFTMTSHTLSVAYDGTYFAASGVGIKYATSASGTWSTATVGANPILYTIASGNGYWVVGGIAGNGANAPFYYRQTDPAGTWTDNTANAGFSIGSGDRTIWGLAYADGFWLGNGYSVTDSKAMLRYTADPTGAWTAANNNGATCRTRRMAYGNHIAYAGAEDSNGFPGQMTMLDWPRPAANVQAVTRSAVF